MLEEGHSFRARLGEALERALASSDDKSVELVKMEQPDGRLRIPLYFVDEAGGVASYCNVDFLILKDDKIRVILEIEEGEVDPVRICGNYLASSFSQFHIHGDGGRRVEMGSNVVFIQIINTAGLDLQGTDRVKLDELEDKMQAIPVKDSRITGYRLLYGKPDDINGDRLGVVSNVVRALASNNQKNNR